MAVRTRSMNELVGRVRNGSHEVLVRLEPELGSTGGARVPFRRSSRALERSRTGGARWSRLLSVLPGDPCRWWRDWAEIGNRMYRMP